MTTKARKCTWDNMTCTLHVNYASSPMAAAASAAPARTSDNRFFLQLRILQSPLRSYSGVLMPAAFLCPRRSYCGAIRLLLHELAVPPKHSNRDAYNTRH